MDKAIHRINQYLICPVDSVIYFTFSLYVERSDFSRVRAQSPCGLALFGAKVTGGAYYLYQKSFALPKVSNYMRTGVELSSKLSTQLEYSGHRRAEVC